MASVSEFIGFLVIQIYPLQTLSRARRRPIAYRNKHAGHDSDSNESSDDDSAHEQDLALPHEPCHQQSSTGSQSQSAAEPIRGKSVIYKPDFWLLALIMSMCNLAVMRLDLIRVVSGCGLMYINVFHLISCLTRF